MAQDVTIKVSLLDHASAGIDRLVKSMDAFSASASRTSSTLKTASAGFSSISQATDTGAKSATSYAFSFNQVFGAITNVLSVAKQMLDVFVQIGSVGFSAFKEVVREAANFEEGLIRVAKVMGDRLTSSDIPALREGLIEIARNSATSAADLLKVAASAGQLGFSGTELAPFVDLVNKMSIATNDAAESVAQNFAKIRAAFNLMGSDSVEQLSRLGSALNELENNTPVLAKNIVESLTRISSARSLELAVQDVAAFATTVQSTGLQASRTGTLMNRFFIDIQTQTDKIEEKFGFFSGSFKRALEQDASNAILLLIQKLRSMGDVVERTQLINEVFGKQTIKVLQPLINNYDQLIGNLHLARQAFEDNVSLTNAYEKASEGLNAALGRFQNVVDTNQVLLGNKFLPVLTQIADLMPGLVDRIFDFANGLNMEKTVNSAASALFTFADILSKAFTNEGQRTITDFVTVLVDLTNKHLPGVLPAVQAVIGVWRPLVSLFGAMKDTIDLIVGSFYHLSNAFIDFAARAANGDSVLDALSGAFSDAKTNISAINRGVDESSKVMEEWNKTLENNKTLLRATSKDADLSARQWNQLGEALGTSGQQLELVQNFLGAGSVKFKAYLNALNAGKTESEAFENATKTMVQGLNSMIDANQNAITQFKAFKVEATTPALQAVQVLAEQMSKVGTTLEATDKKLAATKAMYMNYIASVSNGADRNEVFENSLKNSIETLSRQSTAFRSNLSSLQKQSDGYARANDNARTFVRINAEVAKLQEEISKNQGKISKINELVVSQGRVRTEQETEFVGKLKNSNIELQERITRLQTEQAQLGAATAAMQKNTKAMEMATKAEKKQSAAYWERQKLLQENWKLQKRVSQVMADANNASRRLTEAEKAFISQSRNRISLNKVKAAGQLELLRISEAEAAALRKAKKGQEGKIAADAQAKRVTADLKLERMTAVKELEFIHKKELKILDTQGEKWKAFASNTKAAFDFAGKAVQARAETMKATFASLASATQSVTSLMIKGWDDYVKAVSSPSRTGSREIINTFREQAAMQRALIKEQLALAREQRLALERQRIRAERGDPIMFKVVIDGVDNSIKELVQQVINQLTAQFIAEGGTLCGLG